MNGICVLDRCPIVWAHNNVEPDETMQTAMGGENYQRFMQLNAQFMVEIAQKRAHGLAVVYGKAAAKFVDHHSVLQQHQGRKMCGRTTITHARCNSKYKTVTDWCGIHCRTLHTSERYKFGISENSCIFSEMFWHLDQYKQ